MTTMNMIIALLNLPGQVPAETPEARTRRLLESGSRSSAIDTIDAWLQSPSAKKEWHMEPDAFAGRLKGLVEAPYKLAQSGYPWCTYASVLMCLLRRAPSDVVDYALKLYNTGKVGLGRITGEVSSDLRATNSVDTSCLSSETTAPGWLSGAGGTSRLRRWAWRTTAAWRRRRWTA